MVPISWSVGLWHRSFLCGSCRFVEYPSPTGMDSPILANYFVNRPRQYYFSVCVQLKFIC